MKNILVGALLLMCSVVRGQGGDPTGENQYGDVFIIDTSLHPITIKDPQFRTYVALSSGTDYTRDPGFSLEVGRWGVASLATFGTDIDHNYNRHFKEPNTWMGPKVYATIYQKGAFCYMLYGSPKWQLGGNGFLVEYGLSICYNVSDDWIMALNQYFQSSQQNNFSPGIGLSIVKLF